MRHLLIGVVLLVLGLGSCVFEATSGQLPNWTGVPTGFVIGFGIYFICYAALDYYFDHYDYTDPS